MKTLKSLWRFSILVVASLLLALPARAEVAATETLLIDKLTKVFLSLPEANPTKSKITLRLADLHAERGRLVAKQELEKGCEQCSNGEADRKKALEYYQYVLPTLSGDSLRNVMVQVGHLHELLGQNQKALSFYEKVTQNSAEGSGEAHFSMAEIYFKQKQFSKAESHYRQALKDSRFKRQGLASYRLAWCQYNQGAVAKAGEGLEKILTTPQLLTRGGEAVTNVDQDFKNEVAKDYTVFMAHDSQISFEAIQKVYKLSPENSRIENVSFLAKELERLGQNQQAQKAWELVIEKTGDPQVRMEALVYLAGLELKGNHRDKVLPYLERAFRNWNSLSQCKDANQCDELKKRVRGLVFDWNRIEKSKPSEALISAYEAYFGVAPQDKEAYILASQAATLNKNLEKAKVWNQKALELSQDADEQETLLIRGIEIAELSKDPETLLVAQQNYLSKSTKKTRSSEILYQMAQATYDQKNYQQAADQFYTLATQPATPQKLRLQAAEMALDALVLVKNDGLIEKWGREFATQIPQQKSRFLAIASQSVLSQAATISGSESLGDEAAWQTLSRFEVGSAQPAEKKTYYKNRIILARKLKKFPEMDQSLRSYMEFKDLTSEESRFALENKVWLSEIQLNFAQAFASYKELNPGNWLELARLADLAEKPSQQYYLNYLKEPKDESLAFSICAKLVKEAKSLEGPYQACAARLKKNPALLAGLILEIHAGNKTPDQLAKIFAKYDLQKTAAALVVTRSLLLEDGDKSYAKLARHKLDGRINQVAGSLKSRAYLLGQFEKVIARATATEDWLTQTLFLTQLEGEYRRFYDDLLGLPVPKDLSESESQEYLTLLSQQASPYKEKADQIQFKRAELLKNQKAIDQTFADFHQATKEVQELLGPQIEKLREVVTAAELEPLFLVYRQNQKRAVPSLTLLENARSQVKQAPLSKGPLRQLIQLETARGYQPMVIYLNSRLRLVEQGFETKETAL